jgi:hypothetical protein
MRRFSISLPFFSIVPIGIGTIMLWGFLTIFNGLRFIQCSAWVALRPPPENIVTLLGAPLDRLHIQTENKSIYCLDQGQWSKCLLSPYETEPDSAPTWLIGRLESIPQNDGILQVIRAGSLSNVTYYSLLADGRIFACSTNFTAEVENMFRSGSFVWLLIPTLAMLWSAVSFFDIFIKYGQPTLWDFWGRGERIK